MRINPANNSTIQSDTSVSKNSESKRSERLKQSAYEARVGHESESKKAGSTHAEISARAHEMAKAKQLASDAPDVREAKIAELREKIQNKKYHVSANDIADRLIDHHLKTF